MVRSYSTKNSSIVPVKIYKNADIDKLQTLTENKNKAGVYRWTNLINGKSFVGSSINLGRRFREYFNINFLESEIKKNKSIIYRSLIKSGYSNFSLEILEYCDPSEAISREQYYLDLIRPEYNILPTAGSLYGYKHSEESKLWKHLKRLNSSAEYQAKRLAALKISNSSPENKELLFKNAQLRAQQVKVVDTLTNVTTVYSSMSEAGRSIGVTATAIRNAFKRKKEQDALVILIKNKRYRITKLSS